jgi:hypothetical protein
MVRIRSLLVAIALGVTSSAHAQDSVPPSKLLESARRRASEIERLRSESANRDDATQANLARIDASLRAAGAELERSAAAVAQMQTREQRIDAIADIGPTLLARVRSTEERLIAANRAQSLRAADRVVIIERGLEALRLKAHALHSTAVSFNAGFDLGSIASPASFSAYSSSLETVRSLSAEQQRPMVDFVKNLLSNVTSGVPIVSSLAGLVTSALASQSDNRRSDEMKRAGERLLCVAAVSQNALEGLGSVRRASDRLERLSAEVERRASVGEDALRSAVSYGSGESFDAFMRRTFGDLATEGVRKDLPYGKLEEAMLSVASAARLEYDLSRSSDDLGVQLHDALSEPAAIAACSAEVKELTTRYARLRPAVRDLRESLVALASVEEGIAVFVPSLPGR